MLRWALGFLIVALIAAFLGFGSVASTSMEVAKILCYVFLIFFVVTLLMGLISGRRPSR